ncbi:MAG: EthD domain-containing protein [bacterium]|nr:EthD domain-containing protein [bacterium]
MIKTLALLKRRPDLDRAAFRHHYETTHAPLALPLMTGLVRYVRYHLEEDLLGEVGFDVVSAFWYRDARAVATSMEALAGEAGKPILADELEFMDKPKNTFFPVSERSWVEGEEGDETVFVLVKKPAQMSRYDCSARLLADHWPKLLEGFEGVEFAFLRETFPLRSNPPAEAVELRYNAVLQVRVAQVGGIEDWATELESVGFGVAAVRARRFETQLA